MADRGEHQAAGGIGALLGALESRSERRTQHSQRRCIGIDARLFYFEPSMQRGLGHYTVNHLHALLALRPDWEFILFVDAKEDNMYARHFLSFENVDWCTFEEPARVDVFHVPDPMSMVPGFDSFFRVAPKGVPVSVVFYDLIPMVFHEGYFDTWAPPSQEAYRRRLEELSNVIVLPISDFTRADLSRYVQLPHERVTTIHAGLNHVLAVPALPSDEAARAVVQRMGIAEPYFLALGTMDDHKNFPTVLDAYQQVRAEQKVSLVVFGGRFDNRRKELQEQLKQAGIDDVHFVGYVSDDDLIALYRRARALVFPSMYEGFGFPALEAMAFGCPVVCSNAASLPEVVGDAGVLHDPKDVKSFAATMRRLIADEAFHRELVERGIARAPEFSWQKTAQKTVDAWESMLRQGETAQSASV